MIEKLWPYKPIRNFEDIASQVRYGDAVLRAKHVHSAKILRTGILANPATYN